MVGNKNGSSLIVYYDVKEKYFSQFLEFTSTIFGDFENSEEYLDHYNIYNGDGFHINVFCFKSYKNLENWLHGNSNKIITDEIKKILKNSVVVRKIESLDFGPLVFRHNRLDALESKCS